MPEHRTAKDAPSSLRLAVVSDIHHGPRTRFAGEVRKLGELALPLLDEVVTALNDRVRPDLVVHLGDAIEDVDRATDLHAYGEVMASLQRLDAPLLHVTGNHDEVNLGPDDLARLQGPAALAAPLDRGGFWVLTLAGHATATRCWGEPDALAGLAAQLALADRPVVLFTHQSLAEPDLTGNPWFEGYPERCLLEQRAEVRRLLEQSGKVRAVIGGHLHWSRVQRIAGIPYFTVQSLTENVAAPDLPPEAAAAWALFELGPTTVRCRIAGAQPETWQLDAAD